MRQFANLLMGKCANETLMLVALPFLFTFSVDLKSQDLCNNRTSTAEHGVAGTINGQTIYYEIWTTGGEWRYNAILLRTDTTDISDSVYFCIDELFGTDPAHQDSIFVSINSGDSTKKFYTVNPSDIPTLIQVLDFHYGNEQYTEFNKPNSGYSIKISGNKLFIKTQSCNSKYDPRFEMKMKYRYKKGRFILLRTRIESEENRYDL